MSKYFVEFRGHVAEMQRTNANVAILGDTFINIQNKI